jgi:predicted enzyme related to lactoylglutathione lyase
MDYKLELMCVPVSDVDRAKAFYVDQVGFVADHDQRVNDSLRFVQLTPPGSGCSICIGEGLTTMEPGSVEGLQLVVDDADAAKAEFAARGLEVADVVELPWGRFVYFADPDGNKWSVQQIVRPTQG